MGVFADYGQQADDEIGRLEAAAEVDAERIAEQAADIERLEAELAACQGSAMVTGASVVVDVPGFAKVPVARTYLGPGETPSNYAADSGTARAVARASREVWLSFKEAPGPWLSTLLDSILAVDLGVIVTHKHEPENDGMTPAQIAAYQANWTSTMILARTKGPRVRTASLLMATGAGHTPAIWDVFYPTSAPDLCGFDCYNPGIQKAKAYVAPRTVFGPAIAYAASRNRPLAIGETGTNVVGGDTAGRMAWAAEARRVLDEAGAAAACWWNQGACQLDTATAAAWLA